MKIFIILLTTLSLSITSNSAISDDNNEIITAAEQIKENFFISRESFYRLVSENDFDGGHMLDSVQDIKSDQVWDMWKRSLFFSTPVVRAISKEGAIILYYNPVADTVIISDWNNHQGSLKIVYLDVTTGEAIRDEEYLDPLGRQNWRAPPDFGPVGRKYEETVLKLASLGPKKLKNIRGKQHSEYAKSRNYEISQNLAEAVLFKREKIDFLLKCFSESDPSCLFDKFEQVIGFGKKNGEGWRNLQYLRQTLIPVGFYEFIGEEPSKNFEIWYWGNSRFPSFLITAIYQNKKAVKVGAVMMAPRIAVSR